jgi:hypothetical protein
VVLGVAVGIAFAACTSTVPSHPVESSRTDHSTTRATVRAREATWPQHPRVVGSIRAPEPPADNVLRFKPILLAAYKKACSDVVNVQGAFRSLGPRKRLVLVRCADDRIRAVRLVFTGVVVPNLRVVLRSAGMEEPQSVLAMLGLRWNIMRRAARGDPPGTLIEQEPAPGVVVPFGTTIHVVVAR